jgi:hypothetical protein
MQSFDCMTGMYKPEAGNRDPKCKVGESGNGPGTRFRCFWAAINSLSNVSAWQGQVAFLAGYSDCRTVAPKQKKGRFDFLEAAFSNLIPATTYVPTQLPMQYHRPCEA